MDEDNFMEEFEEEYEEEPRRKREPWVSLIFTQVICVALILGTVLIIKLISGGLYKKIEKWYVKNFGAETTVSEVLEGMYGESDAA